MGTSEFPSHELQVLQTLDALIWSPAFAAYVAPVVERVEHSLVQDPSAVEKWEALPISLFGNKLPPEIQSSWVFILRAQTATGFERHPNSHQRVTSYRGTGDFQVGFPETSSNHLVSDPRAALERRWVSIPVNVWHQPVVQESNWVVVSFHTVPAKDLIEERPDAKDSGTTQQRKYSDVGGV